MALVHGQSITAEQVERIVSREFSPRDFASLCNAVTWALTGRGCSSLPSFTEREIVPDHGIDMEWGIEISDDDSKTISNILGLGWNVFQYKKRDIFARNRQQVVSNLRIGIKGAIKELYKTTGRRPKRYVLFTNIDLSHKQKQTAKRVTNKQKKGSTRKKKSDPLKALKDSILFGYDKPRSVHVDVVGAAELATFLNDLPHIRSAYFATNSFIIWEKAWQQHAKKKILGANVQLTGRDNELNSLRTLVDDAGVRAIIVFGPHEIGKTRLVLEATNHRPVEVVMALDPHSMSVNDLLELESPQNETIVIIDDPEPDQAQRFVDHALTSEKLKLLITLPTAEKAPMPNYGRDNRVQPFRLGPLTEEQSEKLLQSAGAKLNFSVRSWVIEQAGGLPGILLFASSLGQELRESPENFTDTVAKAFETKIRQILGEGFIDKLRLLSLLTHIGINGEAAREIELVCKIFGNGIQANSILNSLSIMTDTGVVRKRGSYLEIHPPLFANYLAESTLRGQFTKLFLLFAVLTQNGRIRLVRRISALKCEEVSRFWDELFDTKNGLLKDLPSGLSNIYLLRFICGAVPERIANLLEMGLKNTTMDERLAIKDDVRRELMWTLEELLFRRRTSTIALRCVALLAEAETENFRNNAKGVFCECFLPSHPQFPLTLQDRLNLLDEFFSSEHSNQIHLLGIEAISFALRRLVAVTLRRGSSGLEPLDARPPMMYEDLWSYLDGMIDLLIRVASSENQVVAHAASVALSHAIEEYAHQSRPESLVERLKTIVHLVDAQKIQIESIQLAQVIRGACKALSQRYVGFDKEHQEKFRVCVAELDALIVALDKGDFPSRLKRWAGVRHQEHHEYEIFDERRVYRFEKELRSLAEEAMNTPDLLNDDLLEWLCSTEAQKAYIFFWYLGEYDNNHVLMEKIEKVAAVRKGQTAFSRYCGGLCQANRSFVSKRLDELTEARKVTDEAIVQATASMGGDKVGVERLERLIRENRVDSVYVEQSLCSPAWIDSLSEDEFLHLGRVIAGPDFRHAGAVIDFFAKWMYSKRPIEGDLAEFAWQCLEVGPTVDANGAFDCDQLAAKLTQKDSERGFRLLERLLAEPFEIHRWQPMDSWGRKDFWNTLLRTDRERTIRIVLSVAFHNPSQRYRATHDFHEIVSQEKDADSLIEFALENEEQARLVCQVINPGRPGFWHIAFRIILKYPDNSKIKEDLRRSIVVRCWPSHYSNIIEEIRSLLRNHEAPPSLRSWLEDLLSTLRNEADREVHSDIDEEINRSWHRMENPDAPDRVWAICSALTLMSVDELQKLFTKKEILDALQRVELEEDRKEAIRKKVESWES